MKKIQEKTLRHYAVPNEIGVFLRKQLRSGFGAFFTRDEPIELIKKELSLDLPRVNQSTMHFESLGKGVAQLLSDRFHVVLPILDGHAGSDAYSIKSALQDAQAKVHIVFGRKEQSSIHTSGKLLNRMLPDSTLEVLPGYSHGELSLMHPQAYAQMLLTLIS